MINLLKKTVNKLTTRWDETRFERLIVCSLFIITRNIYGLTDQQKRFQTGSGQQANKIIGLFSVHSDNTHIKIILVNISNSSYKSQSESRPTPSLLHELCLAAWQ